MYYVIEKISNKILSSGDTFLTSYEFVKNYPDGENVLKILEDVEMEAVSRIVYVDGKCVYKNPKFWTQNFTNFKNNYQSHKVVDILGQDVALDRFTLEDDFLTDERIDKYIAMLDAADAIEYATEEDYFYTAPETEA